jgi:hypothetical protein
MNIYVQRQVKSVGHCKYIPVVQKLDDQVCQWFSASLWFSPGSSTNKTDHYDITGILLKVALNTSKIFVTNTFYLCTM